jgi:hypothetical protein
VPRTKKDAAAIGGVPVYNPADHMDPKEVVQVHLFCQCGGAHRQVDPVELVVPFVRAFLDKHRGDGHGPVSIAEMVAERESRKQAALRATGRGQEYRRKTWETLDPTCTASRPWPVLPGQEG